MSIRERKRVCVCENEENANRHDETFFDKRRELLSLLAQSFSTSVYVHEDSDCFFMNISVLMRYVGTFGCQTALDFPDNCLFP